MKLVKFRDNAPKVITVMSVSGGPREIVNINYDLSKWVTLYAGFTGTWASSVFTLDAGFFGATEELQNAYASYNNDVYKVTTSTAGGATNNFTAATGLLTGADPPDTSTSTVVPVLTKPVFYLNDMEAAYAASFMDIVRKSDQDQFSGDLTDDKTDQFRGEMAAASDVDSVDGLKWWRVAFSVTRRQISAITEDNDYWLTFENPYLSKSALDPTGAYADVHAAYLAGYVGGGAPYGSLYAPRYPAVWAIASPPGPEPYRDPTDPDLVDQPYDAASFEYSYPKATRITSGISVELDLPIYGTFVRDAWLRPVTTGVGTTATAYIYAY